MNRLMYSGVRWLRLMKCSKALFSTFWKLLSLPMDCAMILPHTTDPSVTGPGSKRMAGSEGPAPSCTLLHAAREVQQ